MTKFKKKKANKGGYRPRKRSNYGPSIFLDILFEKLGGPAELERMTGWPLQNFVVWRGKGYVPLKKVGPLSRLITEKVNNFDLELALLNYPEVASFFGPQCVAAWETLVDICPILTEAERERVLKGKPPVTVKL